MQFAGDSCFIRIPFLDFEVGFDMVSYTVDETTGRLEVAINSTAPYPGPREAVLSFTTVNGTAEGKDELMCIYHLPLCLYTINYIVICS